jgi:8-oxo-dGTP pyrophosphatase MutT (NUDIX family)
VRREVAEEVGLPADLYDVRERRGPYRYEFPSGPDRRGYHGQEQWYFRCDLHGPEEPAIDLAGTCGEFTGVRWVAPGDFPLASVPPMKQEVYRAVLRDFFGGPEDSR